MRIEVNVKSRGIESQGMETSIGYVSLSFPSCERNIVTISWRPRLVATSRAVSDAALTWVKSILSCARSCFAMRVCPW
ncbi:hypothetical protein BDZ91DRAFT_724362 [Kalaharituber pfeilii]|nr:hypothetical protein BDZ91DRAFT_724362 [Kalaharituber pfeilii]